MYDDLVARDLAVNWHPYTQMKTADPIVPIVSGKEAYLFDAEGNRYIDAVASWWVNLHGHSHPYIAKKVSEQLFTLEHVIFAGFTHKPAIQLAEQLLSLLPSNQKKVFYTDNGSTAVEVALKMCIQFVQNRNLKRSKILAFENAYHGDTFGAMSVSARSAWTKPFHHFLFEVVTVPVPTAENIESIKQIIDMHDAEIGCFIYEPLVQGAAGMIMYEATDLDILLNYCKSKNILLIQDEIFVGFGRTGKLFACNHLNVQADIMCFSKGLTGGTFPLGVTTCTQEIYDAFYADDHLRALFHGHSFTANPLACTAALASLELLLEPQTMVNIKKIESSHRTFSTIICQDPQIKDVRQCGTILAIELKTEHHTSYFNKQHRKMYSYFLKKGVILRPLGNVIYLVPPYCIMDDDLTYIYQVIVQYLNAV